MTTTLPKPTAIIFDWDGTIIDSLPLVNEAMNAARAQSGLPLQSLEDTHKDSVLGGEVIFRRDWGDDNWLEARKLFLGHFLQQHLTRFGAAEEGVTDRPGFMRGAFALLAWLQGQSNIRCAVLTNRTRVSAGAELPHLGYDTLFETLVCFGEAPQNKPSGAAALHVLESMGITPGKDVWLVGDTWGDVACANEAGLTSVLVLDGEYAEPHQPAIHLRDCYALLELLQEYS